MTHPIIENATFATLEGKTLSYKDLPQNETIRVSGTLYDTKELITVEGKVNDNILVTEDNVYEFVPTEAALIENAMTLFLHGFETFDDNEKNLFIKDIKAAIEKAKELLTNNISLRAVGNLRSNHYRIGTDCSGTIKTSAIKEILEVDGKVFLKTRNSVYLVV